MKNHFDEWAKEYNFLGKALPFYEKYILNKLSKEIEPNKKAKILDLGTGDGRVIIYLKNKFPSIKAIATDSSKEMLKQATLNFKKSKLKIKSKIVNMPNLPFRNNSLDFIVSGAAIHHVKDKNRLFREIFRILKKNGKLVVSDCFEIEDKKYEKLQNKLKKNKKFWKKYIASVDQAEIEFEQQMKNMKTKHPREYHITPTKTKKILEQIGFKKVKIIPTPKLDAIYSAEK